MLSSLLFSALAGFLTVPAEPYLKRMLDRALSGERALSALDVRVLTFALLLAIAAIGTALIGADSSAYAAVIGGALGYFGKRIYAFMRDPHGTNAPGDAVWDGEVRDGRPVLRPHATPDTDDDATLRAVSDALHDEKILDPKEADR